MLTAQAHGGLMSTTGIDLLAQTHCGLLAAVLIPVRVSRGYAEDRRSRLRRKAVLEDDELLLILNTIMEVIQ